MEKVIIEGVVEHGRRLGRELGFPTANVAVPDSVAAEDGVYRSRAVPPTEGLRPRFDIAS